MSKIANKKIADLNHFHFYIPSFQRGYRWESEQATDLLNDIVQFFATPSVDEKGDWYCLQPVIVKEEDNKHHVIDGQQRLTTIYLDLEISSSEF
jgi:uncharacterized protein with ParB-like and HNH nuclease domain